MFLNDSPATTTTTTLLQPVIWFENSPVGYQFKLYKYIISFYVTSTLQMSLHYSQTPRDKLFSSTSTSWNHLRCKITSVPSTTTTTTYLLLLRSKVLERKQWLKEPLLRENFDDLITKRKCDTHTIAKIIATFRPTTTRTTCKENNSTPLSRHAFIFLLYK